MKNKGLGKGLSALFGDEVLEKDITTNMLIELIEPSFDQPRKKFDIDSLQELSNSISQNGILQPIIIYKPENSAKYKIIAGERRWRAAIMAGLKQVPVNIIENISTQKVLELAIVENVQRVDLTPIEEAESYQKLIDEFNYTQEDLAQAVNKSRSHISNILRLNKLPDSIKEKISANKLSMGHVKTLIGVENSENLAEEIVAKNLNVRQAEKLIKQIKFGGNSTHTNTTTITTTTTYQPAETDEDLVVLQEAISESLGLRVVIEHTNTGNGRVVIHFDNLKQLDSVLQKIS